MTYRTLKPGCLAAGGAILLFLAAQGIPLTRADDKKTADDPVFEIDAEGEPRGYDKPPKGPTFYLWYSEGAWHVRTKTKEKAHAFTGVIQLRKGKVASISGYEGLEVPNARAAAQKGKGKGKAKGRIRKFEDFGKLNDSRTRIDFNFKTSGREDGFDFKVNKDATLLDFSLKIDGYGHSENIVIGGKNMAPPAGHFTLVAHPAAAADKQPGKN